MIEDLKQSMFNVLVHNNKKFCVANTLTGAVMALDEVEFDSFKKNQLSYLKDNIEVLVDAGIVIDKELDEIALLRNSYTHYKYNKTSARLTISPTLECNFCCPYCYENRQYGAMDQNVQIETISYVELLINKGISKIILIWYGGEPLLYPEIVRFISLEIEKLCRKNNVEFSNSMISNGYLIDDNTIEMFKLINLRTIQITIDGLPDTHNQRRKLMTGEGTYDKIQNALKLLNDKNIYVKLRVNIDRSNFMQYNKVEKKFEHLENIYCYPALVTVEDNQSDKQKKACINKEEYKEFFMRLSEETGFHLKFEHLYSNGVCSCAAEHEYSAVIDHKGNIYKCINDIGKEKYAVGSVLNKDKNNPAMIAKYMGRDPFTEDECCDCKYLPLCYGRCVWGYQRNGTHDCPAIKYLFHSMIEKEYLK